MERLGQLKRALQRQLNRKPTDYEKAMLDQTARMMLKAEMVVFDPKVSANDCVRIDGAARRARQDFARLVASKRSDTNERTPLHVMLAQGDSDA
jgi:hypothetical protein